MTKTPPIHVGIALSAPWVGALIWTLVGSCLGKEATTRGLQITSKAAMDVDEQVVHLGSLLDARVHAVVFKPMVTKHPGYTEFFARALAMGVPVITLDSVIENEAIVCTVGTDNAKAQAAMTEYAFERLGHRGRVAYFRGDDRLASGVARNASFHAVLARHPEIELVYETTLDWVAPISRQAFGADCARAAFAAAAPLDAIICANDEAALGCVDAIAEAGLTGKVLVTGFDGLPEAMLAIRDQTMTGTVRQVPELIAQRTLDAVQAVLNGETVARALRVDTQLITKGAIAEAALSSLQHITRLTFDLNASNNAQRALQQAIIAKQRNALRTVIAASDAMSRIREPGLMLRELVVMMRTAFGLARVAAYTRADASSDTLTLQAIAEPEAGVYDVVAQASATDAARLLACLHSQQSRHFAGREAADMGLAATAPDARSQLLLPLVAGSGALGVLDLRSASAKAFDDETIEILNTIAHQAGIALDNAALYGETVRLAQSELRETEAKLALAQRAEYLSNHDTLTDLPNRRLFTHLLLQALSLARRRAGPLAVMFIDLDRFKHVNDTLGHEGGDKLLQEAAERMKACLRQSDTVARVGGDEFVVLLPELTASRDAATVAQKIITSIARPFSLLGHEFRVTASIGISAYPEDGTDEQTLTKNADIAMYHAKKEGKNNFQFYSAKLSESSLARLALESRLREALENNEFRLHYQAKNNGDKEQITGAEVLLRWLHPELGLVAPLDFLAVAEETGLIVPLGKWVMRTACQQNMKWQRQGLPRLVVAVNLTQRQFADESLVPDIKGILAETGMAPELLELEISEKMLMFDNRVTLRVLEQLKDLGVRVALDEFGLGYCSLAALKKFPLDSIKIARSFTTGAADNHSSFTEAVIAMGRSLSMTIIAKGVETREQADYMRAQACDEFQGFYFNAPVPAEELTELLSQQVHA